MATRPVPIPRGTPSTAPTRTRRAVCASWRRAGSRWRLRSRGALVAPAERPQRGSPWISSSVREERTRGCAIAGRSALLRRARNGSWWGTRASSPRRMSSETGPPTDPHQDADGSEDRQDGLRQVAAEVDVEGGDARVAWRRARRPVHPRARRARGRGLAQERPAQVEVTASDVRAAASSAADAQAARATKAPARPTSWG